MFSKLLITVILSIFASNFFSTSVFASCAPPVSLAEYKEKADIVVLGRAERVEENFTVIFVERYFKGRGGPLQIQVTGKEDPETITSVDFSFEEGKKYLLFLQTSPSNVLKTNACAGNKEIKDRLSPEELVVLGQGYNPSGNNQDISSQEQNFILYFLGGILILIVVFLIIKRRKTTPGQC